MAFVVDDIELKQSFGTEEEMMLFIVEEHKEQYIDQFRKLASEHQLPQSVLDHLLLYSDNEREAAESLLYGANPQANNSECILGPVEWATLSHIRVLVQAGAKPGMEHVAVAAQHNTDKAVAHYLLDAHMGQVIHSSVDSAHTSRKRRRYSDHDNIGVTVNDSNDDMEN